MSQKLPQELKDARKLIHKWDKVLMPIAEMHPAGDEPVNRYIRENGRGINYNNQKQSHSQTFAMRVRCDLDEGAASEFVYSRNFEPFSETTEGHLNLIEASKIMPVLGEAAFSIGFKAHLDSRGSVAGNYPAITFRGDFQSGDFPKVSKLLVMAESMIDFSLDSIDQTMQRPYHFALVPSTTKSKPSGCIYFREISSLSDLGCAVSVFSSRMKPNSLPNSSETAMLYGSLEGNNSHFERIAKQYQGIFVSVDDFVKSP
jgi:hypothetical protein